MKKIFKSYVNPQHINGICVPLPIQTNFIRTYCERNKYPLSLPSCEILFLGNYTMLEKVIRSDATDVLMISNFLIPSKKFISDLKNKIELANKRLHFILERDVIESRDLLNYIKTKESLNKIASSPKDYSGILDVWCNQTKE